MDVHAYAHIHTRACKQFFLLAHGCEKNAPALTPHAATCSYPTRDPSDPPLRQPQPPPRPPR